MSLVQQEFDSHMANVLFKSCLQSQGHTFSTCCDWPAEKLGQAHEYLQQNTFYSAIS